MKHRVWSLCISLALAASVLTSCNPAAPSNGTNGTNSAASSGSGSKLDYPKQSINFIVPYGAGGGTDVMARAVVGAMNLGVTTFVTNIEGASAGTGSMEVYNSAPDGYTILVHQAEAITTYCTTGTYSTAIDADIAPIATVVWDPMCVNVAASSDFQTYEDIISYSKANPGKLKWASTGTKSTNHLTTAMLWNEAGIEDIYVPYDSQSKSRTAVLGGNADVLICQVSEVKAMIDSGEMRCVAVCSSENSKVQGFEQVPTTVSMGYNVEFGLHRGFFAAPGTSQEIIDFLAENIKSVMEMQDFIDSMGALGYEPVYCGADEIVQIMAEKKAFVESGLELLG